MKVKVTWFTWALALALILSPLLVAGANAATAEKLIVDSADVALEWHEPTMNWTLFWQTFKQHSIWDLEYRVLTQWISVKQDLNVTRQCSEGSCKLTLNFTASRTADYRLTFGIDYRVKNYTQKLGEYQYQITYENMTLTFDWSDVATIPNLAISHGVLSDYFWFRIRKDNVQQGKNVVIDPSIILDSFDNVFGNSYTLVAVSEAQGQSFKFTTGESKYYLKSCKFVLDHWGSPIGHLRANLYEHIGTFGSGGKAFGTPLASSGLMDFPTVKAWASFNFSSPYYALEKDVAYVIAVVVADAAMLDGSNYVKVWGDSGDDGNRCEYVGVEWSALTNDVGFYVYGEGLPSAGGSTVSIQLPNVLWYVKEIGRRVLDFISQRHVKVVLGVAAFMGIGLIVLKHEKGKKHARF